MTIDTKNFEIFFKLLQTYTKESLYEYLTSKTIVEIKEDEVDVHLSGKQAFEIASLYQTLIKLLKLNFPKYYIAQTNFYDAIDNYLSDLEKNTHVDNLKKSSNFSIKVTYQVDEDDVLNYTGQKFTYVDLPKQIKEQLDKEINREVRLLEGYIKDVKEKFFGKIESIIKKNFRSEM